MSIQYNRDGTVLFVSDDPATVTTQLEAAGKTNAQITADYATFQGTWSLGWWKTYQQANLDAFLDGFMNLNAFIRAGTSTTVTAANVGTFIAAICNNYRTLRAAITAATTVAQVQAVNINSGWPANP